MAQLQTIARIHSGFSSKFGIPRQSGIVAGLKASIVFEKEYADPEALRGLERYSHIWLLWGFSQAERQGWSPTVRPPRLGGNTRIGVFATRSPFRPNGIGMSSVAVEGIELHTSRGPVIHVLGADMLDGSPIYDIKPYIQTDIHADATGGLAGGFVPLRVHIAAEWPAALPQECRDTICSLLEQDPRPQYQNDPSRVYGMEYGGYEVRFSVEGRELTVVEVAETE